MAKLVKKAVSAAKKASTPKRKRAKKDDGTFRADDPVTPENEAFELSADERRRRAQREVGLRRFQGTPV